MAAPKSRYLFLRHIPRILLGLTSNKQSSGSRTRIAFRVSCNKSTDIRKWVDRGLISRARAFCASTPSQPQPPDGAKPKAKPSPAGNPPSNSNPGARPGGQKRPAERPLKLMDFPERIWPHPVKSFRNFFFTLLIRGYFEPSFSHEKFLQGAVQVRWLAVWRACGVTVFQLLSVVGRWSLIT